MAMAVRMGELDARQKERVRAALTEKVAAHFAYPGFYSFHAEQMRMRPLDRGKRQEIAAYSATIGFAPLEQMAVDSPELRRYFEGVFLRYLDVNPHLANPRLAAHRAQLRVEARRVAEEMQRELVAFLAGGNPPFGAARPPTSWTERPLRAVAQHPGVSPPPSTPQPQTPQPMPRGPDLPASQIGPRTAPAPPPVPTPATPAVPSAASPLPASPAEDRQVFSQLRLQLESFIRLAVRSYGLPERGGDPARALDDLRSSGLVDDTSLSIAERILALTDRVMERGSATLDDYRQALTLYLLYHRSHLKG